MMQDDAEKIIHTINAPNGQPYVSIVDKGNRIGIWTHRYHPERIMLDLDKKCIKELIGALEKV